MREEIYVLQPTLKNVTPNVAELNERKYKVIQPIIDMIIKNRVKDHAIIEYYLNESMDIMSIDGHRLFLKLCNYYAGINIQGAKEYADIYCEMYSEENCKVKKKRL